MTDQENAAFAATTPEKGGLNHMWIMAACCAVPAVGFLAAGAFGIQSMSWDTLLSLICVVGMGYMMFAMRRDHEKDGSHAGCHAHLEKREPAGVDVPVETQ